MRIFVTTSDYYNPLAKGFAYLFNRNWSATQPITLLGYAPPRDRLPANFEVVSLGRGSDFGNDVPEWTPGRRGKHFHELYPTPRWTDSLSPFFEAVREDTLFCCRSTTLSISLSIWRKIKLLTRCLEREDVVKIDLSRDRAFFPNAPYAYEQGTRIVASKQDAPFRSSLLPAIWRSDYFRALLRPGRRPWAFEKLGMQECMNDGKLILGVDQPNHGPVPYLNVYYSGTVNRQQLNQLNEETRSEMTRQRMIGPEWNGWHIPVEEPRGRVEATA